MWQEPSSEFTLISSASFSASSPLITTSNVCITRVLYLHTYYHDDHCHLLLSSPLSATLTMLHLSYEKGVCVCVCVQFHNTIMLSSLFHHRVVNGNLHCLLRCKKGELPKSYLLALTLHTLDLTLEDRFELLPVYRW